MHAGVWMVVYGMLALLFTRPWFATAVACALMLILVQVSNAKYTSLREPFIFQDYDYFTDAICHPGLYIPFSGWGKFFACVAGGVATIAVGLWLEPAPQALWEISGHFGGVLSVLSVGTCLLMYGSGPARWLSYQSIADITRHGFLASRWYYAVAGRQSLDVKSPFEPASELSSEGTLPAERLSPDERSVSNTDQGVSSNENSLSSECASSNDSALANQSIFLNVRGIGLILEVTEMSTGRQ